VGIESPSGDDFSLPPMQKIIVLDSGAITTSGNYRKYHESKGTRYSHIINPATGKSVQNEMISATVYASDAITADAYDNALMLMGLDRAMKFVESKKDLAAFIIYKRPDGKLADSASTRFRQLISPLNTLVKN
jgi:thiamine biosynthesis lipoprotein